MLALLSGLTALLCAAVATTSTATAGCGVQERARNAPVVVRALAHEAPVSRLWLLDVYKGGGDIASKDRSFNVSQSSASLECSVSLVSRQQYIVIGKGGTGYVDAVAVFEWSSALEDLLWSALGWQSWSDWSPCSASCAEGKQQRQRLCLLSEGCPGFNTERRRCNMFPCKGSVDSLALQDKRYFHPARAQWQRVSGRPSAWRLSPNSYIWVPSTQLFHEAPFPKEFSLFATLRLHPEALLQGTLFSLRSRRQQDAYLSLELGGSEGLRLVHAGLNGTQVVDIPALELKDGRWHSLAVGLHGDNTVKTYMDCDWVSTNILRRNSLDIPEDADIVIGYLFMGDLEQLVVSPAADAVNQQCSTGKVSVNETIPGSLTLERRGRRTKARKAADFHPVPQSNLLDDSLEGSGFDDDADDYHYEVEWSEWSECSVSCGTGAQSRFSRCVDDGRRLELCVEAGGERTETRACSRQPCAPANHSGSGGKPCPCLNGGVCHQRPSGRWGLCRCSPGYTGRHCQRAVCVPECQNGGRCTKPDVCLCLPGFLGDRCQQPECPESCGQGTCVGPEVCACPPGFGGERCRDALCGDVVCRNGGRCVQGTCTCATGWSGADCNSPVCDPMCRHGGNCVRPYVCHCPPGTSGSYCQEFSCRHACLNGGACVGPDQCECPHNSSGPTCAIPVCDPPCENGATCEAGNTCLCDQISTGTRCEKRKCEYRPYQEPYTRGFRRLVSRYQCETWECSRTKPQYQTLYKTFYRTVYRCADGLH